MSSAGPPRELYGPERLAKVELPTKPGHPKTSSVAREPSGTLTLKVPFAVIGSESWQSEPFPSHPVTDVGGP